MKLTNQTRIIIVIVLIVAAAAYFVWEKTKTHQGGETAAAGASPNDAAAAKAWVATVDGKLVKGSAKTIYIARYGSLEPIDTMSNYMALSKAYGHTYITVPDDKIAAAPKAKFLGPYKL